MKKKIFIILHLFCAVILAAENNEFIPGPILTKDFCDDLLLIAGVDFKNGDLEMYEKAALEKKFVLRYEQQSYTQLLKLLKMDYGSDLKSIDTFFADLKSGKQVSLPFPDEIFNYVKDNGQFLYRVSLVSWHEKITASPIGYYRIVVYCNGYAFYFMLVDPYIYVADEKKQEYFKSLDEYIVLKNVQDGSWFDSLETYNMRFCWKSLNVMDSFFEDLKEKKNTLPEYVINFQEKYEKLLTGIIEYFEDLNSPTVTTNLRIRQSVKNGNPIVTIQQGTKVQILETGEADKIDGIEGNWVKVKVPATSKDKDGNLLGKEITGWCFDGYLE